MKRSLLRRKNLGVIAGIGFFAIAGQWLLLLAVILVRFIDTDLGKVLFPRTEPAPDPIQIIDAQTAGPDFVTVFLATAVGIALVGFVIYFVAVRYTRAVKQTGEQVVREVTKKAVPIVAGKKFEQIPKKRRTRLTRRVVFWTEVCFALVPIVTLPIVLHDENRGITELFAIGVNAVLALIALLAFSLRALLQHKWHMHELDVK